MAVAAGGLMPDRFATETPDKPAVIMAGSGRVLTYAALIARARRLANVMRACGLQRGDHVAFMLENTPEVYEIAWAARRLGIWYVAINWHLKAEEAAYIAGDCGAKLFIASPQTLALAEPASRDVPRRLITGGGDAAGFGSYEAALAAASDAPTERMPEGMFMGYSSGTTGRPKGVKRLVELAPYGAGPTPMEGRMMGGLFGYHQDMVYLSPAPLYHAAPITYSVGAQRFGGTVVAMENFDALETLRLIEKHRVTHAQFVPTHFVRMLQLPEAERGRFDVSSLQVVIHAAAPCPVDVKERMLDWWGPVIHEYYAATEGHGWTYIGPEDWRTKPGSVGRSYLGTVRIVSEAGELLPPGETGVVCFEDGPNFAYHNDPTKTAEAYALRGLPTTGDMGYLDADGYLFLTDRRSHMIISGGVNIYPQEAENVLTLHPRVRDVAVIGVPNTEFGEEVKAVVIAAGVVGDAALERELIDYCRARLATYKCPKTVTFVDELPRLPTGKLLKRELRARFWPVGKAL